ncbi:S8 family serine peptidase [Candidatus Roseilinea sp. NK_OTU-006]|uniref:S8 family serine peptidase n=1 Tax=Candidatus Roseilinea sp. NK_OTU-006 TaxID=2704250 RepID=UPI00145DB89F|nr:S8 family serine peptidase [Candidatus Roseilinea sp. NK_OTU-006]
MQRALWYFRLPMQLPFINDLEDVELVLPTPLRMRADAHYTGKGITIAFLDSGFYPHPDLTQPTNRIAYFADARGESVRENVGFSIPHRSSWHGTMTSCVCAGNGFMSMYRYSGLAPSARVVLVKTGNLKNHHIGEQDISRALRWLLDNAQRFEVRVINISLGGDRSSDGQLTALDALVEEAVARGMVVVCAAGNSGAQRVVSPASAPSAITVGGLNDHNSLDRSRWTLYHSSYGRGGRGAAKPEVIAPAQWIAAPMLPRTKVHNEAQFLWRIERATDAELARILRTKEARQNISAETMSKPLHEIRRIVRQRMNDQKFIHPHYQHVDGTSFAAAIVSSVVAQMLEANPSLTPAQVKRILIETAEPLDDAPPERQGAGVVHAGAAVAAALKLKRRRPRLQRYKAKGEMRSASSSLGF